MYPYGYKKEHEDEKITVWYNYEEKRWMILAVQSGLLTDVTHPLIQQQVCKDIS